MSDSSSASELPGSNDDVLELNKNLERMVEDTENMSGKEQLYLAGETLLS